MFLLWLSCAHSISPVISPVRNAIMNVVAYIHADIVAIFRGVLSSLNVIIFVLSSLL